MDKTIDIQELQKDVDHVVDEVTRAHIPYILTRASQPLVVMMAYEDYQRLISRENAWAQFSQTWAELGVKNAQYSEEEIEADIKLAIREARTARKE